jgi:peptide deformylase
MAIRRILELGDPLLRCTSAEVTRIPDAYSTLDDLRDTLHEFQRTHGFGRGIAAVQIGVLQRVIYIEIGGVAYELVNPRLEWLSAETFEMWDDCFSFPNLMVRLRRSERVGLRYQDRDGVVRELEAEFAFAELLQHEVDHLDGVLSMDRMVDLKDSLMTRSEYLRTLEKNPPRTF